MTKYESVRAFHKAFQLDAPDRPTMPGRQLLKLRWKLTNEENREKIDASLSEHPLRDYLDAITDLHYLVHGDAVAAGISEEQLDRAFREVHESNMSKMWSAYEISHAIEEDGNWDELHTTSKFGVEGTPGWHARVWVVKNKLGKVVKSPSYRPVDLSWIEKGEM